MVLNADSPAQGAVAGSSPGQGAGAVKTMLELRVSAIAREADEISSFELVHPKGDPLPAFTAGAHIDVHVSEGVLRQYSLCNDPAERHRYLVGVLREDGGRGGSVAMHETVHESGLLTVSAPRNHFPLAGREANFHLLLAGGIGVTPIMAMIVELEARGAEFLMHYCTRSPEKTAFKDRLAPLIEAGRVLLHHDGGDPAKGLDLAATLADFRPGMHCYVCGPPGFMNAALSSVGHWPPHAVHSEYFTAPEGDEDFAPNEAFQIKLARTGEILDVPADKTIVEVLRAHGHEVETSCEEGYCGTCLTGYLDGEPEHRDTVLDDSDRGTYVMVCCARAKSPVLVLDL